jgi:hypothetical protein
VTTLGAGGGGLDNVSAGPKAENEMVCDSGKGDVWRCTKEGGDMASVDTRGGGTVTFAVVLVLEGEGVVGRA